MANDTSVHETRFWAAVRVMKSLPEDGPFQPSDDMLTVFYGYYKQATAGPCNVPEPSKWDTTGKAKWKAWKALEDMSKEKAMMEYVQEIQLILETIPLTEDVADLVEALGDFYEVVEDEDSTTKPIEWTLENGKEELSDDEEDEEDMEDDSESFKDDLEDDTDMEDDDKDSTHSGPTKLTGEKSSLRVGAPLGDDHMERRSLSSMTESTHSSLHSRAEEELSRMAEPSHRNDDSEVIVATHHQACDSDVEVNCGSWDQTAKVEGSGVPRVHLAGTGLADAKRPELEGGSGKAQYGCPDDKAQTDLPLPPGLGTVLHDGISSGIGRGFMGTDMVIRGCPPCHHGNRRRLENDGDAEGGATRRQDPKRQISLTLMGLQRDMQEVLQRLDTLEARLAYEPRSSPHDSQNVGKKILWWWPLDLSPVTVTLAVAWPFVVHWLVGVYLQRRRR